MTSVPQTSNSSRERSLSATTYSMVPRGRVDGKMTPGRIVSSGQLCRVRRSFAAGCAFPGRLVAGAAAGGFALFPGG